MDKWLQTGSLKRKDSEAGTSISKKTAPVSDTEKTHKAKRRK